jgi:DNA-binding NtrC family response regulator
VAPTFSESALRVLTAAAWPGNVRELENTIERALTLNRTGVITEDDLPASVRQPKPVADAAASEQAIDVDACFAGLPTIDEMERRYVSHVLQAAGGNRKHASEILGINRRTLYRMAARFRLDL